MEPLSGFEPETPSLPWKCSTTELQRHFWLNSVKDGDKCMVSWCRERDSNPRRHKPADLQSAVFDRFTIPANRAYAR